MLLSRPPRDERLVPFVDQLWFCTAAVERPSERVLPTGRGQLIVGLHLDNPRFSAVQGPATRASSIDALVQRRAVGVAFRAGGTLPFFGESSRAMADEVVPLATVWGRSGETFVDQLHELDESDLFSHIEAALSARLDERATPPPPILAAERAVDSGVPIGALAREMDVDRRRLASQFTDVFGTGLKKYGRLRRFERTVQAVRTPDAAPLAHIAADLGYADQAHLTREFREFAGITPGVLHARATPSPNHLVDDEIFKTAEQSGRTIDL